MPILELGGETESAAIHDTCMVAIVADDIIVAINQLTDNTTIDCESCSKTQSFFFAHEFCQFLFQLYMYIEGSVEETASCASAAVFLHGSNTCINHSLVTCQTCISIRTEHEDSASLHHYFSSLFSFYFSEIRIDTLLHEFLRQSILSTFLL